MATETATSRRQPCNVCGSPRFVMLFADVPDRGRPASGGIVRCSKCGLVYRTPRPPAAEATRTYEGKLYPPPSADWIEGRKAVFRHHVEWMLGYRQTGCVLDVGAGDGYFLAECASRGWRVRGIEPSIQCRETARRDLGLDLLADSIEQAPIEPGTLDVVTFWNVLDQLADPRSALAAAHRLLRPGGAVVIRVPNAAFHVPAKKAMLAAGMVVPGLRALRPTTFHLYSFSRETLTHLLRLTGYVRCRARPARLSWTAGHDRRARVSERVAAALVDHTARIVHALTAGRLLLSPSIVTTAEKTEGDVPGH